MKLKIKKRYIFIVLLIVIVGIGAYLSLNQKQLPQYTTTKAEIGNLVQTVSETGSVKTANQIDLNFLSTGKISKQNVKIGDKVVKDQILAELDYSNLIIQQKQSQATLDSALASLSKIKNGATSQDIAISQATANQAQSAYINSQDDLKNISNTTAAAIAQAQKSLDDINNPVINSDSSRSSYLQTISDKKDSLITVMSNGYETDKAALDAINRILTDTNIKDTLSIQDASLLVTAQMNYSDAINQLTNYNFLQTTAKSTKNDSDVNTAFTAAITSLNKTLITLNSVFSVLQKTITTAVFNQATLDGFKSSISNQISLINSSISGIQSNQQVLNGAVITYNNAVTSAQNNLTNAKLSAQQQITAAKSRVDSNYNSWQIAKAQFEKTIAGPRIEDIRLAEAQVLQAQAAIDAVKNQISNSIIKSPINGQVTKVNYDIGETPNATLPVISVLTENGYQIDVDISEADISKIKLMAPASITFDAFGDSVKYSGDVIFIEPAQTIIQGVVYYKATIGNIRSTATSSPISYSGDISSTSTATSTLSYDAQIKPGMTSNVTITTAQKNNVLIVPNRAIIQKADNTNVVRVLQNNQSVEYPVQVGLKGDDGLTEIISGINAGDLTITAIKLPGQ